MQLLASGNQENSFDLEGLWRYTRLFAELTAVLWRKGAAVNRRAFRFSG
jgi:hypothetical protein